MLLILGTGVAAAVIGGILEERDRGRKPWSLIVMGPWGATMWAVMREYGG